MRRRVGPPRGGRCARLVLGSDFQAFAVEAGYNKEQEDALLAGIAWPEDGYRLFEIATPDECSAEGWLQPLGEANALFLKRHLWEKLGGMDERSTCGWRVS